ncbi:MAG: VPLPA-CTERM sorting domain-containing protein [Gammaproteobacteria bacterium]|jgi:hypothetical protein
MNTSTNVFGTSRAAAILLVASACWAGPQQAGAAITSSTDCAAISGVPAGGYCYVVDTTDRSWSDAETAAQALDPSFHLVSIHSATENAYVGSLFTTDQFFWIGLNDATVDGTFVWSDGSPVDYTNWLSGEPTDTSGIVDYVLFDGANNAWLIDHSSIPLFNSVFSAPISGVPVPAAAWLFGSGLIGLAGVARKMNGSSRDRD